MKNLDSTGLKRLHREWRRRAEPDVALLLDSVQTPYNVGAILRVVDAAGVDGVVRQTRRAASLGSVARSSAGALAHVR